MADIERYSPSIPGRIAYEHLHRYALARDYVADADVLDIACGEGYGSFILSSSARHVVGIDNSAETIAAAGARYLDEKKLEFHRGDATALPAPDATFDVVVSFETIEHLLDAERFLAEIKRVLKPDGLLIVSSPNEPEYQLSAATPNPFHVREFDRASFEAILAEHFAHREMYGQRMLIASSLSPTSKARMPNDPAYRAYTGDPGGRARLAEAHPGVARLASPEYLLCFCSDAAIVHPVAADSIFVLPEDDLWLDHRKVMGWASGVHDETSALRERVGDLERKLALADAREVAHREQARFVEDARAAVVAERAAVARMLDGSYATIEQHKVMAHLSMQREEQTRTLLEQAEQRADESAAHARRGFESELAILEPLLSRLTGVATAPSLPVLTDVLAGLWHDREMAKRDADQVLGRAAETAAQLARQADGLIAFESLLNDRSDEHAKDRRSWLEVETGLREHTERLEAQLAVTGQARAAAQDKIARLSDRITSLDVELANAKAMHESHADALRRNAQELRLELAERERERADEAAQRRALVAEASRLADLLRDRDGRDNKARTLVARLARDLADGSDLSSDLGLDPDEELAWTVEFITYRSELRRELLDAARSGRRSHVGTARCAAPSLSPLEPGEDLCERLLFSEAHYGVGSPDLADDTDHLRHYLDKGWRDGRSPHALFDGDWYVAAHPEAAVSGLSPLSHYVRHGAAAGLQPHPCFDRAFYTRRYPESLKETPDAFQHFLRHGLQAGNAPSARIEALAQRRSVVDVMSLLLDTDLHQAEETTDARAWPAPIDDYWLPQALRDYLGDEFSQGQMAGLSYLFSVIAAYDGRPDAFAASRDVEVLIERARRFRHAPIKSRPDVSIVIPVFDNLVYTLTSIVSILELRTSLSFEIIVGDDGSTDATPETIERLGRPIVLARHPTNLGFLRNCNACARRAEGRYLVFLNNDTIALPGWLDELIAPLEAGLNIGMTGSKLINGDGTLQEAGGILWNDGSAWNYGRGADPRLPHFNYSKEVDYCSGASIAISKTLWDELGGFDVAFLPAYCEDSDLAFRVRVAGSRTWLAASSVLVHHEGRSHGTDLDSGIKAYQATNQAKFLERWRATLAAENQPNAENVFVARDRSARKPHIVIVDHYIPQWDCDAGSRTMLHFIKMFAQQGFHVTLWPDNLHRDRPYAKPLQDAGIEIIYGPQYVGGFEAWYRDVAEFVPYVLLSRPQIAEKYIDLIDPARSKVLFYGHDLHWKRLEKQWSVETSDALRQEMYRMRELEERICRKSDVAFYPSQDEIEVLSAQLPDLTAAVVPAWCFDPVEIEAMRRRAKRPSMRDAAHLMFVGGFQHQPNVDGVLWFVHEVWPSIKVACAHAKLTIVGSKPPKSVRSLVSAELSINVAGHIGDAALDRLYAKATAAIVPLRFGGGVKGKVVEAFSKGLPVVSTEVGVQGMLSAHDFCFVADSPAAFAEKALTCFNEPGRALEKVLSAIEFLARSYSLEALVRNFAPFIPELGQ